ncbi:MAG: dTMP kinase [Betaproteobacteria bacterium]|nr:dTMP kinase [Betaproteobacteria bacterium]MBI2961265.1 dTMP kinase [Betaproteobacteria bacterium]
MPADAKGKFITLEGIDGAGKSTHLPWLADRIRATGRKVVVTREPGGTPLGEKLRELLLSQPMHVETETMLMFAARREHMAQVIVPALGAGRWVISDRFTDATFAYQGGGRGLSRDKFAVLEQWVQGGFQPDLTLYFDLPVEVARARLAVGALDRFERENAGFFARVRAAYLDRAASDPGRVRIIDAGQTVDEIKIILQNIISTLC